MAYSRNQMRTYINEYREKRRQAAYARFGSKCLWCNSQDQLEFDHVDPSSKLMSISAMWTSSKVKFEAELAKCQLLCRPCHVKKSIKEGSFTKGAQHQKTPFEKAHGSNVGYRFYKCRCSICREWKRQSRNASLA